MANILPVSDLRNYNEVLKNCHKGEPVYQTKNGRGRFVVVDIEDYERDRAEKKLLLKLQEAEEAVKDGEGWLDLDELKHLKIFKFTVDFLYGLCCIFFIILSNVIPNIFQILCNNRIDPQF